MANYGADKKPIKKKKKAAKAKDTRKIKKNVRDMRAGKQQPRQSKSDSGPAINRIVAEGGWGWGSASIDAQAASQSNPTLSGPRAVRPTPGKDAEKPRRP